MTKRRRIDSPVDTTELELQLEGLTTRAQVLEFIKRKGYSIPTAGVNVKVLKKVILETSVEEDYEPESKTSIDIFENVHAASLEEEVEYPAPDDYSQEDIDLIHKLSRIMDLQADNPGIRDWQKKQRCNLKCLDCSVKSPSLGRYCCRVFLG